MAKVENTNINPDIVNSLNPNIQQTTKRLLVSVPYVTSYLEGVV